MILDRGVYDIYIYSMQGTASYFLHPYFLHPYSPYSLLYSHFSSHSLHFLRGHHHQLQARMTSNNFQGQMNHSPSFCARFVPERPLLEDCGSALLATLEELHQCYGGYYIESTFKRLYSPIFSPTVFIRPKPRPLISTHVLFRTTVLHSSAKP